MKQYIDKSALVAEIERRKNQFVSQAEAFRKIGKEDKESYFAALASNMNSLSCFLDTLEVKEEPVSEDLEEASADYARKTLSHDDYPTYNDEYELMLAFEAGAKWGMEQAEVKIQAQSIAVAHGCPKESVSEDLEEAANDYAHDILHDDVFETFIAGAKWQKNNLWKDAQGDDLPEIDREVIALVWENEHYKVVFAHRPPKHWDGKNLLTGEITTYTPKRYDKGGWNQPDAKWWLDLDLPKTEEPL